MEELEKKMRLTNQRQVILEELRKVTTHPTASELYDLVRQRLPRIGLGTVYRNLELLSERGIIKKLETGGEQKRFDGNPYDHYHIRCIQCDRIVDAHIDNELNVDDVISKTSDFKIIGHKLEFIGLCPRCAEDSSPA